MSRGLRSRIDRLEQALVPEEPTLSEALTQASQRQDQMEAAGSPDVFPWDDTPEQDPLGERVRKAHQRLISSTFNRGDEIHFAATQAEADRLCASLPPRFYPDRRGLVVLLGTGTGQSSVLAELQRRKAEADARARLPVHEREPELTQTSR